MKTDVLFNAGNSKYSGSAATAGRNNLKTTPKNWTIQDGGGL
jgi:hypothetical protein